MNASDAQAQHSAPSDVLAVQVSFLSGEQLQVPVAPDGSTCQDVRRAVAQLRQIDLRQLRLLQDDRVLLTSDRILPGTAVQCEVRPVIPRTPSEWYTPDRYALQRTIGTGAYSSVSEARDSHTGDLVAIKRCKNLFDNNVDCKRILRELGILQALDHECIVQLRDVFTRPQSEELYQAGREMNEIYMVMEICGSDLRRLTRTEVTLETAHISTIMYNLFRGLHYLHSAGIYHRDLKPANCLVNQNCSVKICDFNLSRAMGQFPRQDEAASLSRRQMTHHVVSRWYRAPEVILLQRAYSQAIDAWSAGCILADLFQMLPGGPEFHDRGPLFPGQQCHPLSPRRHGSRSQGSVQNDQLNVICRLLGSPSEAVLARLDSEDARRYMRSLPTHTNNTGLRNVFAHYVDEAALQLLEGLLCFDAVDRMTVQNSLAHPFFEQVRDPASETVAPAHLAGTVARFEDETQAEDEDVLERHFLDVMRRVQGP